MTDADGPVPLPPGLDLLWGRREAARRGPRPGLSVEAIVAAALDIANAEGLDAVSMAKVAQSVGFTTMSLYRYIDSKDELLQLMWNAVSGDPVELEGDTWRSRLLSWAMGQRAAIDRNVWIVQMPMATPPLAPNSLAWMERGLEAMDGTGLTDSQQIAILGLLASHALIDARMAFDARQARSGADETSSVDYGAVMRELVEADRFPRLHRAVWSGELDPSAADDDPLVGYRFDLEVILDGIEALIAP